eukprot:TRINITY_DN6697_c0_g1_i10.p1 TRINITY_DN6697_c0_g1~~TRINITY_DN6697_c0_g1_i10.p1  ORF type:complete len:1153 (-),score=195.89 TRINITY_DN6697_c0_g1_i10:394-3852(-)
MQLQDFLLLALAFVTDAVNETKPIFNLGFLGPLAFQGGRFYENLFAARTAQLDFESADALLDCNGCNSRFGLRLLAVDDSVGGVPSQALAREGALNLELGNKLAKFDFEPIVGLLGGQIPSNCASSVEIGHIMQVPQIAWGCAMEVGAPGQYPYFARTHQMDFPLAFAAITKYFAWSRFTIAWQQDESFSASNSLAIMHAVQMDNPDVMITEVRLGLTPEDSGKNFASWKAEFDIAMRMRNNIWFAALSPDTSKVFFPKLLEWGLFKPWMQWVVSGSCKSSIIGELNLGENASPLLGILVIRPYSYHSAKDGWMASKVYSRILRYTKGNYSKTPEFFGLSFPFGTMFDPVSYGESIKDLNASFAMQDSEHLGGGWASNHNWPFVYDAFYSFAYAIDALLKEGTPPGNIKGKVLAEAVANVSFVGISKAITFEDGKRPGDWAIDNFQPKLESSAWNGWKAPQVGSLENKVLKWKGSQLVFFMSGATWLAGSQNRSSVPLERLPRCDDGSTRSVHGGCLLCQAGKYSNDDAGRWASLSDPDREQCSLCPVGTFAALNGSKACLPCGPGSSTCSGTFGTLCFEGQSTCSPCPPGTFAQAGGRCTLCQPGTYSSSEKSQLCELAPPGHHANGSGVTQPSQCPMGLVAPSAGTIQCQPCGTGSFAVTATTCQKCPAGRYADQVAVTACSGCGNAMTTVSDGASSFDACVCAAGSYGTGGTCNRCPAFMDSATGTANEDGCSLSSFGLTLILLAIILPVGIACSFGVIVLVYRHLQRKYEAQKEAMLQERLLSGVDAVNNLAHPMVLISAQSLVAISSELLRTLHEGIRNDGLLIYLDTLESVAKFKDQGKVILFYSYQWLSWSRAGPDEVQLACMKSAVHDVCSKLDVEVENLYIWLDIVSIPQCSVRLKNLAVNALYTYARQADVLVVIAPQSTHEDLGLEANLATYKRRVWCRAEQMAFFCSRGASSMFIKHCVEGMDVEPVAESYMQEVSNIFDGEITCCTRKHPGGCPCDRLGLVAPLTGMYFDLHTQQQCGIISKTGAETLDFINQRKDMIFPRSIEYISEENNASSIELFGDMIARIEAFVNRDADAALQLSSSSSKGATMAHVAAHSNLSVVVPDASPKERLRLPSLAGTIWPSVSAYQPTADTITSVKF